MIKFYNEHLNKYLSMVDGDNLTFSGESQYQSLDTYTCNYSFEINFVIDEVLYDSLTVKEYPTGEYETIDILGEKIDIPITKQNYTYLIINGVKAYVGRLITIETTPVTMKCAYKAIPYCDLLKDFVVRDTLQQYFERAYSYSTGFWETVGSFFDPGKATSYLPSLILTEGVSIRRENDVDVKYGEYALQTALRTDIVKKKEEELGWTRNILSCRTSDFLNAIGIKAPATDNRMYFQRKLTINRDYIARFDRDARHCADIDTTDPKHLRHYCAYRCFENSPIYGWNKTTKEWQRVEHLNHIGGTNTNMSGFFYNTIRQNKSIPGMTIKAISFEPPFPLDTDTPNYINGGQVTQPSTPIYGPHITSDVTNQGVLMGVYVGQKWTEGGKDFAFGIEMDVLKWDVAQSPECFYVTFNIDLEIDASTFYNGKMPVGVAHIEKYNPYIADIPIMLSDISLLQMTPNKFLNELSLNCVDYRYLRNPCFINNYNRKLIWNDDAGTFATTFYCTDEQVAEIKREIDTDAKSDIIVRSNAGVQVDAPKHLNDLDNETEVVEHTCVAYGFSETYPLLPNEVTNYSSLPFLITYDGTDKAWKYMDNTNIDCVFGYITGWYENGQMKVASFLNSSTDYDYLLDYSNKYEKYTFKVRDYKLQEKMCFEGQWFNVAKYSTTDFKTWELECYKETEWKTMRASPPKDGTFEYDLSETDVWGNPIDWASGFDWGN